MTIDVNNLKDLNVAQYAFLHLLQSRGMFEDAISISGISNEGLQDLIDKEYTSEKHEITNKFTKQFNQLTDIFLQDKGLERFVERYRAIFPAGNNQNGYPYKGDKQSCMKKMRKFLRTHPYTEELILLATREYVTNQFFKGYTYMQTAPYLIEKDGNSNLAGLCEGYKSKTKSSEKRGFEEDLN